MTTWHNNSTAGREATSCRGALAPAASVFQKLNDEQRARLQHLLTERIDYVNDASFARTGTARELFGPRLAAPDARPWCNRAAAVVNYDELTDHKETLTTTEEHLLFRRYNYARCRMSTILDRYAGRHLTIKAVAELLWWHEQAQATRDEIVRANMPLVLAMAKRTRLSNVDYMELISEGNMALLRSVEKFDCSRGFKFSTYACRAILKSFSRVAMRTSRYRGRFPTEFDPTLERSTYQDEMREDLEADCVDELRGIIRQNTAALNDVEVQVIRARFALGPVEGLEGEGPKTLEQVGILIGVTKERVRQIQNRALEKLRVKLQEDFLAA
jgi:RNA polymerase sigma factor (sigma-70 family)